MIIKNLEKTHIEKATELVLNNYKEEKLFFPDFPEAFPIQDIAYLIENGIGVAAFEDEELIGFLCSYKPIKEFFGTHATGTFIPLHGHAAILKNRSRIYQRMYQSLAQKLVSDNILYHAISLFAHDCIAINTFFDYGFGKRCMDKIAKVKKSHDFKTSGFEFSELPLNEFPKLRERRKELDKHLTLSPCFMVSIEEDLNAWLEKVEKGDRRTFVAKKDDAVCAYLDISDNGENFITYSDKMKSIHGAWCNEKYRGIGLFDDLLYFVHSKLADENIQLLGVDHESFNPTALNYWKKHFTTYTNSLVRRIDENFQNDY